MIGSGIRIAPQVDPKECRVITITVDFRIVARIIGKRVKVAYGKGNPEVIDDFGVERKLIAAGHVFDPYKASVFNKSSAEQLVPEKLAHHLRPGSIGIVTTLGPGAIQHLLGDVFIGAQVSIKTGIHVDDVVALNAIDEHAQVKPFVPEIIGETESIIGIYVADKSSVGL
ncbi:hypothetical protein D3C87_1490150 [compost metagenome]